MQRADDLTDGGCVQPGRGNAGSPLGVQFGTKPRQHRVLQCGKVIAKLRLACGDRDFASIAHRQHAATHGAPARPAIDMSPGHH